MEATAYPKMNIEIAQSFFEDCADLLLRYDKTIDFSYSKKSRRFKCFNDLRSAYECALKSIIAYKQPGDSDRKGLIRTAERHGHKITQLEKAAIASSETFSVRPLGQVLDELPIGLRYTLDGFDFLAAKEKLYYQTIGSDQWLAKLRSYIASVYDSLNRELSKQAGIVSIGDIPMQEILDEKFNKYRK